MGGPGDPPAGTPEGAPGGGEDEYRSVVFDESFVRAARLQEYSARERMIDHARAVRRRPAMARPGLRRGLSRQAMILVVLITVAFGTAIYMGVR
uniref:SCO2583/SCO2584 N-terminal domain-containing protein n=1 Tax=Streptomyces flavofungini TaxID=68200 RepID=UPI003F7F4C3F